MSPIVLTILSIAQLRNALAQPLVAESALREYMDVCGDNLLCFRHDIVIEYKNVGAIPLLKCPSCKCDVECTKRGDCCPDKHMSTCISATILNSSPEPSDAFYMVSTCPDSENGTLRELCTEDFTEKTLSELYPVSSRDTGIAYKNKYCAACNNVQNWQSWYLNVDSCKYPYFDINLYSSFDAILQGVEEHQCHLMFAEPLPETTGKCEISYSIGKCNITGLWKDGNKDIEFACENYHAPYRVFRNVFCYICNIGDAEMRYMISTCPSNILEDLKRNCTTNPIDTRTLPYKNKFCRNCNILPGVEIEYNKRKNFYSENTTLYEASLSVTNFNICQLRLFSVYSLLKQSTTIGALCDNISDRNNSVSLELNLFDSNLAGLNANQQESEALVNMSAIFERYKRHGGTSDWCTLQHGPVKQSAFQKECSCGIPSCFSSDDFDRCCPDILLNPPVTCTRIGEEYSSVVTKCPIDFNDIVIKYLCERIIGNTFIDDLPVYGPGSIEYKNIFCSICNLNSRYHWISTIQPRDLYFKCYDYIDVENFMPLPTTKFFPFNVCNISFLPYENKQIQNCKVDEGIKTEKVTKCNDSKATDPLYSDLQNMCENTNMYVFSRCRKKYLNIICEMCNLECKNGTCSQFQPVDKYSAECKHNSYRLNREKPCVMCGSYKSTFAAFTHGTISTDEVKLEPPTCPSHQFHNTTTVWYIYFHALNIPFAIQAKTPIH